MGVNINIVVMEKENRDRERPVMVNIHYVCVPVIMSPFAELHFVIKKGLSNEKNIFNNMVADSK